MAGYEVQLEVFEGPLDLLLFLIKKDDLDINNIPIAHITKQYLGYLELIKELNLDLAGEFLVLASTLMAIKAKTLLPSNELPDGSEGPDPRAELVAKLVEYQKFKQAAQFLEKRAEEFSDIYYRGAPVFADEEKSLSIGTLDLLSALREVLDRAEDVDAQQVLGEEFPIEEKIEKILAALARTPSISWEDLFADERKRRGIIACFLAVLELTKLQRIFVRQDENFGKIVIFKKEGETDAAVNGAADGK
jgi:segregation and condensation protein A